MLSNSSLRTGQRAAEKIRQSVEQFLFLWEGKRYTVGVSIGLVELLPYHLSVEQVLVMADTACYMAKDRGRNRVHVFVESDQDMQFRQLEMQWVNTIKEALEKDQFFLVAQNIQSKAPGPHQHHYEILLRLMNTNGNLCSPGQFLPAAERYNLMPNIDRWVIKAYFSWLSENPEHLAQLDCASINLSTHSIGDKFFANYLIDAFERYAIPAEKICFEITEGMAIIHLDNTQAFIERFRALGCRFALDDFGTGFSSYAYLKDLQVDYLKIDGVFVNNICDDEISLAMVKSISEVAKAIGIETIAEFVEDEATLNKLSEIGIDYFQGYHVHKPSRLDANVFHLV
ncbi:MAG: GGDEF domain-containing phosphodiesterase [Pseudomonadota bacterium]|nr:GGDEF domain-containing phosphodiesterase [Pseudomonadota bacterium]